MGKISYIPIGGLGNRFRAMASAVALAEMTDSKLDFYWFQDWALNAPFSSLFIPFHLKGVTLHESSLKNQLLYDRPRKRNAWIPLLFQKLYFRAQLYEKVIYKLRLNTAFFTDFVKKSPCYIASYHAVVPYNKQHLQSLFQPVPEIKEKIDARLSQMSDYRIGLHVRRTDNVDSIRYSPDELFYEAVDAELKAHPDMSIYLATDSEQVKKDFRQRYGKAVFFSEVAADRNSIEGIREGIVEMFVLANTQRIYGSFQSSFSELASQFGDSQLIILKKED